jgi:hypothetical protein
MQGLIIHDIFAFLSHSIPVVVANKREKMYLPKASVYMGWVSAHTDYGYGFDLSVSQGLIQCVCVCKEM